jgi:hypothetical protein
MIGIETQLAGPIIVSEFIPAVDYYANETLPNLFALVLRVIFPWPVAVNADESNYRRVAILSSFYNGGYLIRVPESVENEMAQLAVDT